MKKSTKYAHGGLQDGANKSVYTEQSLTVSQHFQKIFDEY